MLQTYRVKSVRNDLYAILCRDMLLRPFLRVQRGSTGTSTGRINLATVAGQQFTLDIVQAERLKLLAELRARQLPPCKTRLDMTYAANCPPYVMGLEKISAKKPCGYQQICPWCWGRRRVAPVFTALERGAAFITRRDTGRTSGLPLVPLFRLRDVQRFDMGMGIGSVAQIAADYLNFRLDILSSFCSSHTEVLGHIILVDLHPSTKRNKSLTATVSCWIFPSTPALRDISDIFFSMAKALGGAAADKGKFCSDLSFKSLRRTMAESLSFKPDILRSDPERALLCLDAFAAIGRALRIGGICRKGSQQ